MSAVARRVWEEDLSPFVLVWLASGVVETQEALSRVLVYLLLKRMKGGICVEYIRKDDC